MGRHVHHRAFARWFAALLASLVSIGAIPLVPAFLDGALPALATTTYHDTVVGDSPVAYWRLTGATPSDEMGNAPPTSIGGTLQPNQAGALLNDSATSTGFNGSADIRLGAAAALRKPQFSVEAWFKTTASAANQYIYRYVNGGQSEPPWV